MAKPTPEQLLGEFDELIRSMPSDKDMLAGADDALRWSGHASALVRSWDSGKAISFDMKIEQLTGYASMDPRQQLRMIKAILYEARSTLQMEAIGPMAIAIGKGSTFDYFDELRKIIELATEDILFVDPYMDADFIARYMPYVRPGIAIRLLTTNEIALLVPAAQA